MWLTASTTYNNSSRGDNYYLHTVEWKDNSYLIEFSYSNDWQYNVGDWDMVLTKSYAVYLPEDYDGLFFAAETQPDNYPDCAKRMQMDSIAPEAAIMDIDTLDPYSKSLFQSLLLRRLSMTLETAVLLLLCAAAGIAACGILLWGENAANRPYCAAVSIGACTGGLHRPDAPLCGCGAKSAARAVRAHTIHKKRDHQL